MARPKQRGSLDGTPTGLDKIIRAEAGRVEKEANIGPPGELSGTPRTLEDVPDAQLATWARLAILTAALSREEAKKKASGDVPLPAAMLLDWRQTLLRAPYTRQIGPMLLDRSDEMLWAAVSLMDRRASGGKASAIGAARYRLITFTLGALHLMSANGASKRSAAETLGGMIRDAGLAISDETIRKDWPKTDMGPFNAFAPVKRRRKVPYAEGGPEEVARAIVRNWLYAEVIAKWKDGQQEEVGRIVLEWMTEQKKPITFPVFAVVLKFDLVELYLQDRIKTLAAAVIDEERG